MITGYVALLYDPDGSFVAYGPFRTELAARDWGMEAVELGVTLAHVAGTLPLIEPLDLGYDPGL